MANKSSGEPVRRTSGRSRVSKQKNSFSNSKNRPHYDDVRGPRRKGRDGSVVYSNKVSNRAYYLFLLFLVVAIVVLVRLVFLCVIVAPENSQAAKDSRITEITLSARRGTIYDRNGNILACSIDATTIYAVPKEIKDPKTTASKLSEILQKDAGEIEKKLSDTSTTFVYLSRKEKVDVAKMVEDLGIDGIYFVEDSRREYPYAEAGGTVVGFINMDGVGMSGLEYQYDDILSGVDGSRKTEHGVMGVAINDSPENEVRAVNGKDIVVSLDIEMQIQLEEILKQWKDKLSVETEALLMDASTGEIYAAASTPLLNPADISHIDEGATELTPVSGIFEPGSIFKTISALAILEDHAMDIDNDIINCPPSIKADEYYVSDAHERGTKDYSLRQIIQYSSNVGISLATEQHIGFQRLYDRIIEYGLNKKTGIDYPGEGIGYLTDVIFWSKIQSYNITFGQGISVTPLQLMRVYCALLNQGFAPTPHFLISYTQAAESPHYEAEKIIHDPSTITDMTSMLQSVVSDGTAQYAQIEGYTPAGKTGTAEIADPQGGYKVGVYNTSFLGFLPNSTSSLLCYMGARNQPFEGNVSGMFKDIMKYAIGRYGIVQKQE